MDGPLQLTLVRVSSVEMAMFLQLRTSNTTTVKNILTVKKFIFPFELIFLVI